MRYLVVLFIFLTGCGIEQASDPRDIHGIDAAFTGYISQFESLYGNSIGDVPMQFGDLDANVVGECIYWNTYREVKISSYYWQYLDNEGRYSVIFHELGHCVLGRGHDTATMPLTGRPDSFMYPYVFFYSGLVSLLSHYNFELFNDPGAPTIFASSSVEMQRIQN